MNEPKSSGWLQRLVGADPKAIAALEEQLNKAKHEAQQLGAELAREREELTQERQKLAQSEARARAAEEDFEARLAAATQAQQQKLSAAEELERKHKLTMGELLAVRTGNKRLADEKEKLAQTLTATKAQLAEAQTEVNLARDQARERQRLAESAGGDLAEAQRKLQALETRSSTLEHELAQARQAEEGAEAGVASLRKELTDAQSGVANLRAQLSAVQLRRERALSMAQDLWRALQGVVGDGAALALVMGVETGNVTASRDLVEASAALKRAFESKALCQGLKVESLADGIRIELRGAELSDSAVTAPWLVAAATRFLEKSAGLELALDSSSVERDTLTLRLSPAVERNLS